MTSMHFIGLDIHKKTISYCVKDVSGKVLSEGTVPATRVQLNEWMKNLPAPWTVPMEATNVHRLDLRSLAASCGSGEGGASTDAAGDRGRQEEERPHRCKQDLRLPAMRLPARVPYGFH